MAADQPKATCALAHDATHRVADLLERATTSEEFSDPFLGGAGGVFAGFGLELSEFERDCVDWGALYGVAYALVREEDPWETPKSVADRAVTAAWARWENYAGGKFTERLTLKSLNDLIVAYRACPPLPPECDALTDALIGLANAYGWTNTE